MINTIYVGYLSIAVLLPGNIRSCHLIVYILIYDFTCMLNADEMYKMLVIKNAPVLMYTLSVMLHKANSCITKSRLFMVEHIPSVV